MPRIHLWCPEWLHRRMRLERPNLNQSKLFNQALLLELDGPGALAICEVCGQRAAKLLGVMVADSPSVDHG